MWGLEVSHNPVRSIPAMAFYGLERALWELHLHANLLTEVPVDAVSVLKKLSVLNLAGEFCVIIPIGPEKDCTRYLFFSRDWRRSGGKSAF